MRNTRRAPVASRLVSSLAVMATVTLTCGATMANAAEVVGPSMMYDGGVTYIAVEGPYNSLMIYWQDNGSKAWGSEQVAGPGTTYSAPALTQYEGDIYLAAEGPYNQLLRYFDVPGTDSWNVEPVAGVYTTYSAPSIMWTGQNLDLSAMGPDNELMFYQSIPDVNDGWSAQTVAA